MHEKYFTTLSITSTRLRFVKPTTSYSQNFIITHHHKLDNFFLYAAGKYYILYNGMADSSAPLDCENPLPSIVRHVIQTDPAATYACPPLH